MRAALAEAIGTALLLAAVVGSGIMGERLAQGNVALALLANSLATGFALDRADRRVRRALGRALQSGGDARVRPARRLSRRGRCSRYIVAQFAGALLGVLLAHAMFDLPLLQSSADRAGPGWASG